MEIAAVQDSVQFIETALGSYRLNRRDLMETLMLSEEFLALLRTHAPAGSKVTVSVFRRQGIPVVKLFAPGAEISWEDTGIDLATEQMGEETEEVIRGIMISSYADSIKYRHNRMGNSVTIITGIPERALAIRTVMALVFAAVVGTLVRLLMPEEWHTLLLTNLFQPIETLFVSGLLFVAAPAVFVSVTCSMIRFKSLAGLGNGGKTVLSAYLGTSVFAVGIGMVVFRLFDPGHLGILATQGEGVISEKFSVLGILNELIPNNLIVPFLNVNSLQLMVMAIVIGVAINLGGTRTTHVKNLFEELDVVCSNLSVMIMSAVPFAVFCSAVSVIVSARVDVVIAALELVLVLVVGVACTAILQLLLLVVTTGLNPLTLLRKYIPAMKKTFLKGSGVAAIPITMRACQRQFGVSRKVSSVTIPLGATINMDGNCVSLTVITLFLSKLYGVTISGGEMLILLFLAVVLSVGAPIAPGTIILCVVTLLTQMGIALDAVSLIIGINFVLEMLLGVVNSLGDVVVALIVAKHEGELDEEVYNKKMSR